MLDEELEVLEYIRTGIEALYFQTWSVVQAGRSMSMVCDINMGVKQGCAALLVPVCFAYF